MTDISMLYDPATMTGRLDVVKGDLLTGDDLKTAICLSLFTDRIADDDDQIDDPDDRRGCWIDAFNPRLGSRLWELKRQKITPYFCQRARDYALESLQWLIDDGVVEAIDVGLSTASVKGQIWLHVSVSKGRVKREFEFLWRAV